MGDIHPGQSHLPLGRPHGIVEQQRDRHRPDPVGHGRDLRSNRARPMINPVGTRFSSLAWDTGLRIRDGLLFGEFRVRNFKLRLTTES